MPSHCHKGFKDAPNACPQDHRRATLTLNLLRWVTCCSYAAKVSKLHSWNTKSNPGILMKFACEYCSPWSPRCLSQMKGASTIKQDSFSKLNQVENLSWNLSPSWIVLDLPPKLPRCQIVSTTRLLVKDFFANWGANTQACSTHRREPAHGRWIAVAIERYFPNHLNLRKLRKWMPSGIDLWVNWLRSAPSNKTTLFLASRFQCRFGMVILWYKNPSNCCHRWRRLL